MIDLISRQAALIAIRNLYPDMPRVDFMDNISNWQKRNKQYIECENAIENLPSAQKTGTWLHERLASTTGGTYPIVRCSACMGDMPFEWPAKYCPHCGARMESDRR